MDKIIEFLKSDNYIIIMNFLILLFFIFNVILIIKYLKLDKKYKRFIKKIGNGKTIEEDLRIFMDSVEKVKNQNVEIIEYCNNLDKNMSNCIQKVGIVRYSAFKDTGSDLSFAVALLDEKNDGIVLNGIYSREMSNIYAKPIENGNSRYTLSNEEIEAIEKAMIYK